MTGDIDFNASASAEANAVKTGNIAASASLDISPSLNVTLNQNADKVPLLYRAIAGVKKALKPAEFEKELAEARLVKARSDVAVYDTYRLSMPWLDDRQAFLYANGYVTTAAQAENVFASFAGAEKLIEDVDSVKELPPDVLDDIVDGTKAAYDQKLRELWEGLIAAEMTHPGDHTKRTMQVLRGMSVAEADAFKRICSFSTQYHAQNAQEVGYHDPKIVLVQDGGTPTYNDRAVGIEEVSLLDSIGLIDKTMQFTNYFYTNIPMGYIAGDEVIVATNETEQSPISVYFKHASFRPAGRELSRICGFGSAPTLGNILEKMFSDVGLSVRRIPRD